MTSGASDPLTGASEPVNAPDPVSGRRPGNGSGPALMTVDHLKVLFPIKSGLIIDRTVAHVHAVDDVSFTIGEGETLGVVGESGCGKTTLSRALVRLINSTGGSIKFRETDITKASRRTMQPIRREMQMVFQDPQASLNPRKRIRQILETPLKLRGLSGAEIEAESRRLLERVGMRAEHMGRYPHEFSGGQRQRIGIARALALNPKFIVCDEPIAALDVSIQAQVVNLLEKLQDEFGLTYLFISHDLSMVRHIADRVAVMYLGKMVELAPRDALYDAPLHPYTEALLSAVPEPDTSLENTRQRIILKGDVPSPANPPKGCAFCTRCPKVMDVCRQAEPGFREVAPGRFVACHLYDTTNQKTAGRTGASEASPQTYQHGEHA